MAPKPKRPDYTGSLASYKQSVADKPKSLDLPSPNEVVNWASGIVASGRTAAGQTQAVTPGDKGVRTMGQGISMANNMLNPYSNTSKKLLGFAVNQDRKSLNELTKSAAVDALITGAAAGVAKTVQVGINKTVETGLAARIQNMVKGETVLVHGSPVRGITELQPSFSRAIPNEKRVFGMRTDVPLQAQFQTQSVTTGYATGGSWVDKGRELPPGGGSLYVFKAPKKTTDLPPYPKTPKTPQFTESGRPIIQLPPTVATSTKSPGRVVAEIPLRGKRPDVVRDLLKEELKKAGAKVEPNVVEKMLSKAEAKKIAKRAKNNPSVV
jgi:hypothetical protein